MYLRNSRRKFKEKTKNLLSAAESNLYYSRKKGLVRSTVDARTQI